LVETYAQFIDRMDEWDDDPPKMETMTDEELEALAENLVTRMHP
jgi:mono/diheme cytochrome c family protein